MAALLYTLFFTTGASALIFETLWFRQAGLALGNSVWASSLVLAGFMGGLALGNALAARYGDRLKNPIGAYAIAEAAVGVMGAGLVYALPGLGQILAPWLGSLQAHPWILNPSRLVIAFALLLIPSTAMGVTLPLLTRALVGHDTSFGRVLGKLYGVNTLGAVMGAMLGESYLLPRFHIHGTALIACALSMFAAIVAIWLSTWTARSSPRPAAQALPAARWSAGFRWLAAASLSGFCLLALEVVWFRFLLLFVLGQSIAFVSMLSVVLAGIALGGLSASVWLRYSPEAHRFSSAISFLSGILCVICYGAFPHIIKPLEPHIIKKTIEILEISIPLMFPVSFMSGLLFTLLGAALYKTMRSEAGSTGALTLSNTVGAALGSIFAGFLLVPILGTERSFFAIAILYGVIGVLLAWNGGGSRWTTYPAAVAFLVGVALFPFGTMADRLIKIPEQRWLANTGAEARVVETREGLTETIIYFESLMHGKPLSYSLLTNAYSMSGTTAPSKRYMKLYVYWPVAVHPDLKRALLICYGVGNTAKALTDSKRLESIDVVDISRDILEMNRIVYPSEADRPLHDPRVRVHVEDGRYFLQTTSRRFDLITGEPPPPDIAGVVSLYTREYFQLLRDRLDEGGIVTYWLPLHALTDVSTKAILRSFCDAFEDCSLWSGMGMNLMMVGTRNASSPVEEGQFVRQWSQPDVAAEMKRLGFERPEQLGALFVADGEFLRGLIGDSPPLTDDDPKLIEAPLGSRDEVKRIFQGVTDTAAARERFQRSPLIRRLWPERMLEESVPYFEYQELINRHWYRTMPTPYPVITEAHRVLTRTTLSTLVLWLLGSDTDIQRIVASATPVELEQPELQFHLGIHFISEREYDAAVEPLRRAEASAPLAQNAYLIRVFALCMSGRTAEAQRLAHERFVQSAPRGGNAGDFLNETPLPPYWQWLKKTFGVDPR